MPSERVARTVVCNGWTAYPAFSSNLQRCWVHILREAKEVAADHDEAEPVYRSLKQVYVGLQSGLETDSADRERAQMHHAAQT